MENRLHEGKKEAGDQLETLAIIPGRILFVLACHSYDATWLNMGYSVKVEQNGLVEGLDMEYEGKRRLMDGFKVSGLRKWVDRRSIYSKEESWRRRELVWGSGVGMRS